MAFENRDRVGTDIVKVTIRLIRSVDRVVKKDAITARVDKRWDLPCLFLILLEALEYSLSDRKVFAVRRVDHDVRLRRKRGDLLVIVGGGGVVHDRDCTCGGEGGGTGIRASHCSDN